MFSVVAVILIIMKVYMLKSKIAGSLCFVVVFVLLFFFYGLHKRIDEPPQSIHTWRQTNCTSLTLNYYQYNLPLLEPEMHNQFGNGGTSGKAVGEFPIIYYFVAQLWKIFGKHEWIFRLVQVIILFLGLFSLFHLLRKILKKQYLAGFAALLVFTSPMVIFYGPNFMPDVPALAFVFIAWYFVVRFLENRRNINLWISALFFCLSMLLKITSGLSFIALGGWILFELLFQKKEERIFNFNWKNFLPFMLIIFPVILWYEYADYYNTVNRGFISYHGIWPIWNVKKEQFSRIIDAVDKIFFKEYFLPYTQYLTFAVWVYLVISIKKLKPVFRYFIIVLPIGLLVQLILWFAVLNEHDYYLINLLAVFVTVWTVFLLQVTKLKARSKYLVYGILGIFFIWNTFTCREQAKVRYIGWMNKLYDENYKALTSIEPSFEKWGIKKDDKVISIPDPSINGTLYYMNRKGFTEFGSDLSNADGFYQRIEDGAKYLIVNDTSILSKDYLAPFIQDEIGRYKDIRVFNIEHISKNTTSQ